MTYDYQQSSYLFGYILYLIKIIYNNATFLKKIIVWLLFIEMNLLPIVLMEIPHQQQQQNL
jgi:hypothetical protein